MRCIAVRVSQLLLALAIVSSAASAQSRSWSVCGGNIFNTCASVELAITGTTVRVRALNLSGTNGTYAGTIFTGIGFDNLNLTALYNVKKGGQLVAGLTNMSGPTLAGRRTPEAWIVTNDKVIGGGLNLDFVGTTNGGIASGIASDCALANQLPGTSSFWVSYTGCGGAYGINNPSVNGGWVQFSFTIQQQTFTQAELDAVTLLVKGQNGVNGGSTEMVCGPGQCVVTPEPITLVLMGTGLVGIGAARRRRKKAAPVA